MNVRLSILAALVGLIIVNTLSADSYTGKWVEGDGDLKRLELIDHAFESIQVSSRMTSLALLYKRDWDGLVEGPIWPCWWEQNSFGPSYGMMPFLGEPYATWLKHSQALWFELMADGKRKDANGFVGPDGCLVDAAGIHLNGGRDIGFGDLRPKNKNKSKPVTDGKTQYKWMWYRQGDGKPDSHDWYLGGTAAGLIMESERLLVEHDSAEAQKRLPQLKRVAAFLDSRRDPETNLLKAGNGANLLAPSYGSYKPIVGS